MESRVAPNSRVTQHLKWYRASATGIALVFLIFSVWSWYSARFWPHKADFASFWAAGRLTLEGHPALAYDFAAHHAAEQAAGPIRKLLPFPYPPPFLAIVAPFAVLPYGWAFYLWLLATGGCFACSVRRFADLTYAFAMPSAFINLVIGQTGFLMTGIFIWGISLLERSKLLSGLVFGLLILKPQLALLLPIAMIAGKEWRVIGGAAICASALFISGALLFGWSSYTAFYETLPRYVGFMREARLPWNEFASTFALSRYIGLSQNASFVVHVIVAVVALIQTARAWRSISKYRVPILFAATILMPPYLFTYDSLLLIVPIGWMLYNGYERLAVLAWLCCLSPLLTHFTPFTWPNLVPIAAAICLCVLELDARLSCQKKASEKSRCAGLRPA